MTSLKVYRDFIYREEPDLEYGHSSQWSFHHVDYDGPEDKRCGSCIGREQDVLQAIDDCIDHLNLDIPMEQEPAQ